MLKILRNDGLELLKWTQNNLISLSTKSPNLIFPRYKNTLNIPRRRNPYWFVRSDRRAQNESLTQDNVSFVKEIVESKFGPKVMSKGILTYSNPVSTLIKVDEMPAVQWNLGERRTGVIARKIGQYPLWLKNGTKMRTTLLQIVDNHVIKYTPPEEYVPAGRVKSEVANKLGCLLVGAESANPTKLTKEYCGLFKDSGVIPKKLLARFLVTPSAALLPGTQLNATHFRVGDFVDVRGKTVDRGFQGVVVRHGFKGMPASHGVTKTHRRGGNIAGGGEKARVWPGTKMPGHMGNRYRIMKGLKIWRINTKNNVLWVSGAAIPGETNGMVYIYDSILPLRRHKTPPPFPTYYETDEELPEDIWCDEAHDFKTSTIQFKED